MGKMLEQWMAANSAQLAQLQPNMAPPMAPPGSGMPPPTFQAVQPQATPVQVARPGQAQAGTFGAFAPPPMAPSAPPQPAFAQPSPDTGVSAFMGQVEKQAPPEPPKQAETEGAKPTKGGEKLTAAQAFEQAPEAVDNAVEQFEQMTGAPIEEGYQKMTGNPPPRGMSKREIGNFMFEFGLNLLSAPAGMSDVESFAGAAQQTLGARGQRAAAREAGKAAAEQQEFERGVELSKLGLKKRELDMLEKRGPSASYADVIGADGTLYSYDKATGKATPVTVDGEPIRMPKKAGTGTQAESIQLFNQVMDNHRRIAELQGIPFEGGVEMEARRQAEAAARRIKPEKERSEYRMRADAMDDAVRLLQQSSEFAFLEGEERQKMLRDTADAIYNYAKFGDMTGQSPGDNLPDASRLQSGMATPVTDAQGNTTYWTLDDAGKPRKVSEDELAR